MTEREQTAVDMLLSDPEIVAWLEPPHESRGHDGEPPERVGEGPMRHALEHKRDD